MLPPIVTVVIPCFNAAATIEAAVDSVLAQSDIGVEIVLVDDCSTDRTAEVARDLAARHPSVAFFAHAKNAGPGPARNTGLRKVKSDYVCFLDADDTYAPGFFRAALKRFRETSKLAAVYMGIEFIDCPHEYDVLHYYGAVNFQPSNKMLRRSVVELIGGFPEDDTFRGGMGGEDGAFFQVLTKYFKVQFEPEKLCRHYVGANSHFTRFVRRTRVENGKLTFVDLEPIEQSGALTAAILAFEKRFLDRCRAAADSTAFRELRAGADQAGLAAARN